MIHKSTEEKKTKKSKFTNCFGVFMINLKQNLQHNFSASNLVIAEIF